MTERTDRQREDWLEQLGEAVASLPEPMPEASATARRLPTWPMASSAIGLLAALLVTSPFDPERPAGSPPQTTATVPQVQGWTRSSGTTLQWPQDLPHLGYQGVEPPVAIASNSPTAPAPEIPTEPPLVTTRPPPAPELPPQALPQQPARPTAIAAPEPAFVPPLPAWSERGVSEHIPTVAPLMTPSTGPIQPRPIEKNVRPAPPAAEVAQPNRRKATKPERPPAQKASPASQPHWSESAFVGPRG